MNKTRKRSFTALLFVLASLFVLVLSLGIFCACDESAGTKENGTTESASGSTWYYGDKAPAESLGKTGDYYLNTETRESYIKEGKTWRVAAEGEACSWHYGTAAPDETTAGEVNDFYLDTKTGNLYQKTEGGWKPILTLKGESGRNGVMWFSGKGVPGTVADALENDFYLDTTTFDVYQYHKDENGALTWGDPLGTLKGAEGQAAKEPIHFYDGYGDPNLTHPVEDPQEGDLFLGRFSGVDEHGPTGEGSGSRLYRYHGDEWEMLMESMNSNVISIYNYEQLVAFRDSVATKDYAGMEVHLKADIDFNDVEPASLHRAAAALAATDWTPIGTSDHPFKGIFDGEGNTIKNFSTTVSTDATEVGFFGNIDGATIQNLHFVDVTVDATKVDSSTEDKFVGGVVVGQAQGDVTVKNVTVSNATVNTAEGTTEENAPAVGGLVGKLGSTDSEKETTLKVEGSSVEGSGTTDLVADKEAVSPENVTIIDSSVTDGEGNKTAWDEGGNHYAEDEDENRTYFVGSAADLENLLSTAEAGKPVSVTLESDLTLDGSAPLAVGADLTIDVGENNLTVKSQGTNAGIQVEAGKNLTIKGAENGKVSLDSASSKPAISVKGSDATLDIQGADVSVKNTNSGNSPAIVAEKGASVNIGGGSKITVEGQGRNSAYKEPQFAKVTGNNSTINIDDENTVIDLDNATGIYAENNGTINFKNGTLNMTGGSCCVGLGLGAGAGNIVFSGGTINITGEITGKHAAGEGLENVAIAIGSTQEECNGAEVIVSGGVINLAPTAGIAIAFGGAGADGRSEVHAGGGVKINLNAVQDGKAYAASSTQGDPGLVIYLYNDTYITGEDEVQNFKVPQLREHIAGGLWGLCGASVGFYDGTDPNVGREKKDLADDYPEYTKKAMGIVTE